MNLEVIPSAQSPKGIEPVKTVQQTGEKNIYINHANIVNVNISKSEDSTSSGQYESLYYKGSILSHDDSTLLEEFKKDYSEIMEYCINTDFTSELVRITLSDEIDILFKDKWRIAGWQSHPTRDLPRRGKLGYAQKTCAERRTLC